MSDKSPKVILPVTVESILELREQLEKYERMLTHVEGNCNSFQAPEVRFPPLHIARCRVMLIKELLLKGSIITWDFSRNYEKQYPDMYYTGDQFNEAMQPIAELVEALGGKIEG